MSEDDDGNLIVRVAREMLDRHGSAAAEIAREQASIADGQRDFFSGEVWYEIAHAIEQLQAGRG